MRTEKRSVLEATPVMSSLRRKVRRTFQVHRVVAFLPVAFVKNELWIEVQRGKILDLRGCSTGVSVIDTEEDHRLPIPQADFLHRTQSLQALKRHVERVDQMPVDRPGYVFGSVSAQPEQLAVLSKMPSTGISVMVQSAIL